MPMKNNKTYRCTFRLDEEQNTRLLQMIEEAGMTGNKSRFILSRIFG